MSTPIPTISKRTAPELKATKISFSVVGKTPAKGVSAYRDDGGRRTDMTRQTAQIRQLKTALLRQRQIYGRIGSRWPESVFIAKGVKLYRRKKKALKTALHGLCYECHFRRPRTATTMPHNRFLGHTGEMIPPNQKIA